MGKRTAHFDSAHIYRTRSYSRMNKIQSMSLLEQYDQNKKNTKFKILREPCWRHSEAPAKIKAGILYLQRRKCDPQTNPQQKAGENLTPSQLSRQRCPIWSDILLSFSRLCKQGQAQRQPDKLLPLRLQKAGQDLELLISSRTPSSSDPSLGCSRDCLEAGEGGPLSSRRR